MASYYQIRAKLKELEVIAGKYQDKKATPGVLEQHYATLVRSLAAERYARMREKVDAKLAPLEAIPHALPGERQAIRELRESLATLRAGCDAMYINGWDYLAPLPVISARVRGLYRELQQGKVDGEWRTEELSLPFPALDHHDVPLAADMLELDCATAFSAWQGGGRLPNPVAFASDVFLFSQGARFLPDFNYAASVLLSARVLYEAKLPFPLITSSDRTQFLELADGALQSGLPRIETGEPFRDGPSLDFLAYVVDRIEEPIRTLHASVLATPIFDIVLRDYKDTQTPASVISFLKEAAGFRGLQASVRDVSREYQSPNTSVIRVTGIPQERIEGVLTERVTKYFRTDIEFKAPETEL